MYGMTKLTATQMAIIYHNQADLDVTIFRTSNVYGPHPKAQFQGYNVINNIIDLAMENKNITIYGEGKQLRDYIYIDDLIEAFILCSKQKATGQIYNLGYGKGISFNEMIQLICKVTGKGKLNYQQWPKETKEVETGDYISNISKIKKDLGFSPRINFQKGIEKTLEAL